MKRLILDGLVPKPIASNMTNLELCQVLEDTFDKPTEFMREVLRRFNDMAERESDDDEIEGQSVPISCNCPICGSTVDLTLANGDKK